MANLTLSQRAADSVTWFCGSWTFIIVFAVFTFIWIALNVVEVLCRPFDPYPFILLNLVFTVVELFQGPLILMSQNRQVERDKETQSLADSHDRETILALHGKLDYITEVVGRIRQGQ